MKRRLTNEPRPKKRVRQVFSDPLLAFDESETVEDARLSLARKIINSVEVGSGHDSDIESDEGDYTEQVLRKKALLAENKWSISWGEKLEKNLKKNKLPKETLRGHRYAVTCVCVSNDEKLFFSGSKDGTIIIWDLKNRKKLKTIKRDASGYEGHAKAVLTLDINSDGTLLASGGKGPFVYIWDVKSKTLKHRLLKHNKDITAVKFQDGTNTLYSASLDRKIGVWDASIGLWKETLVGPTEPITCLDSLAKPFFVCSGMDKAIRFFKVQTGKHLLFPGAHKATIDCITMINQERWVSGGNDGMISLWGPHKRKNLSARGRCHDGQWITALASRAYGDVFVSGSSDGFINFYRIEDDDIKFLGKVETAGYVNDLAISKNGNYLICGIGQEQRLGRWGRTIRKAKNSIVLIKLDGQSFTLKPHQRKQKNDKIKKKEAIPSSRKKKLIMAAEKKLKKEKSEENLIKNQDVNISLKKHEEKMNEEVFDKIKEKNDETKEENEVMMEIISEEKMMEPVAGEETEEKEKNNEEKGSTPSHVEKNSIQNKEKSLKTNLTFETSNDDKIDASSEQRKSVEKDEDSNATISKIMSIKRTWTHTAKDGNSTSTRLRKRTDSEKEDSSETSTEKKEETTKIEENETKKEKASNKTSHTSTGKETLKNEEKTPAKASPKKKNKKKTPTRKRKRKSQTPKQTPRTKKQMVEKQSEKKEKALTPLRRSTRIRKKTSFF